jgi:outer membrane lipoprotein SlyB
MLELGTRHGTGYASLRTTREPGPTSRVCCPSTPTGCRGNVLRPVMATLRPTRGNPNMKHLILIAATVALAACSTTSPDVISRTDAQRMSTVVDAVVLSTRPVVVEGSQSGLGAAAGGVVGGVAGAGVGGRRENIVVGVIGAVVGSVVGNAIERSGTREDAVEILVQLKNGERRAIVQAKAGESFVAGDPVIIVSSGGRVRVTKAPAISKADGPPPRK